ncbi:MAG: tRNA (adenosine(37)-N6)-threonylcarbamoyltransferase complex ATPase subunit type 1 TsaE [Clostridia bacterium]|nr:tRNA (adenosine(37)-N6)-threonylcarbamoyltransferase complex ATPase subunit type 1 TsaE [Clostridia bacterium]
MKRRETTLRDEGAAVQFGARLGELVFEGAFIAFFGGLGAGKTTIITAAARALGAFGAASPTFTIVREYSGRMPLFHFDAYRLRDEHELYAMGFDDYLERGGAIMLEWSERVAAVLPPERLELHLEVGEDNARRLCAVAFGGAYEALLEELIP